MGTELLSNGELCPNTKVTLSSGAESAGIENEGVGNGGSA
jgi:hypothetical protein